MERIGPDRTGPAGQAGNGMSGIMGKVKITRRALIQRINRKLEPKRQTVKAERGRNVSRDHFLIAGNSAVVIHLEQFGREIGCLQAFEELEQNV